MTDEAPAGNVIEALARVMRDLPAIGKGGRADPKQGGYAYRGIEQVTAAAQPLLAKHGVIFTPHRVVDRQTVDIVVNGKPWTDEKMTVLWRVYGPGGREDFIEIETPAIGRDNSDKGANKCMTQAFKYALIPTLCISDSKDDGDQASHEADSLPAPEPVASKHQVDEFNAKVEELEADQRSEFLAWKADQGFPWPWPLRAFRAMEDKLAQIVGASEGAREPSPSDSHDADAAGEPTPDSDKVGSDAHEPSSASPAVVPEDLLAFSDDAF